MIKIASQSIAHVALKTPDLERSLGFYRDTLGFEEMMRINNPDGSLMLVYLRMTDTQYLEVFPGGKGAVAPDWGDTAINHFCLQVADIHSTAEDLRARGISFLIEPQLGLDGNWQCWIGDPDGNRIEFMQMLPGCMQELAIKRLNGNI